MRAAREDYDAVVKLTRRLVRVPSRSGIDPSGLCWSACPHGLPLDGWTGGATVALACEVPGGTPGPRFVLDACLDTAPFGDEAAWTYPPTSGQIAGRVTARPRLLRFESQSRNIRPRRRPTAGHGGRLR